MIEAGQFSYRSKLCIYIRWLLTGTCLVNNSKLHILNTKRYRTLSQCSDFRCSIERVKRGKLITALARQFFEHIVSL